MKAIGVKAEPSATILIDNKIAALADWRGETLSQLRRLILASDPGVVEEWKWSGPVWSHNGIVCTGEVYKTTVKLTFAKGAAISDPQKLFNASLDGNVRRAIDVHEGEMVDAVAFKKLIQTAIAVNASAKSKRAKP